MSEALVEEATKFRDKIPELEGLLIGKLDGSIIWADTLKDLNHEFILSSASLVYRAMRKTSESIEKNEIEEISAEIKGGYLVILIAKKSMIVGFCGDDARSQLAIIKQNLRMFANQVSKHL